MNIEQAINVLQSAVQEVVTAALSDDLTSLGNSVALNKAASSVGTCEGNPDVVIFGDLNRFHNFNKLYGHTIGDTAIAHVGQLIEKHFVKECQATAFRRSGDEFVILLSSQELQKFESRVSSFATCSFPVDGELRETSMSFGYAVSEGEIGFLDLLARAETACRIAKDRGDGVSVGWSESIADKLMFTIRGVRCNTCKAKIDCDIPEAAAAIRNSLQCCPYCSGSLLGHTPPEN